MRPQRGNATAPPAPSGAWPTYRRLLGYLRPHRAMFLLGVLGMILFAATDAGWAAFVRFFLDGTFVGDVSALARSIEPADIAGLEIYQGIAGLPIDFNVHGADCGVVVVWTIRGTR